MEMINNYILDDEDIAFEYELQKDPTSSLSWNRYIETWKEQNSKDSKRRPITHIIWLYNRFLEQFKDDLNFWNEFITWMIQINTVTQGKYTEFVLHLHEKCLENIRNRDSEKICIQYLKIATEACNLAHIRKSLDASLKRVKNKSKHADIWGNVLNFLKEKLIPVCSALGEDEESISFNHPEDNDGDEKSELEKLEILVYKSLFGSKNDHENDNNDTDMVNVWASQLLERYLIICPPDKINDILLLLSKTYDYPRIQSCFKKFLFSERNHGITISLYLIYLNCLDRLSLFHEYKELMKGIKEKYPKEEINLFIFNINRSIKRSNNAELSDKLVKELEITKTLKDFMTLYNYSIDFEQAYINIILQESKIIEVSQNLKEDLTYHISQLGRLLDSKDIMISDLRLRQNPNSIIYWRDKIKLKNNKKERAEEYGTALAQINSLKVNQPGELGKLWSEYAQLYWDQNYYSAARKLYETATKVPYPFLEDLEMIYFQWADNELHTFGKDKALNMLALCLKVPESFESDITKFKTKVKPTPLAQTVLFNSLKLWNLYLDLLESKPLTETNIKETINAYETIIRLKLVTPLVFVNYADYFSTNLHKPMESYKIYERMLDSFSQSVEIKYEIWMNYLSDVIRDRATSGIGKESIRELFENCISQLKVQDEIDIIQVYLHFNSFEEAENQDKPTRQSINILLEGARFLADKFMNSKIKLWQLSLDKTMNLLGPEACRPIFEECIQKITPDSKCVEYVLKYASLEKDLKEWRRVRGLLQYGARLIAPINNAALWTFWENFEVETGDEVEYKKMLILKKQLEDEMIVNTEEISQQDSHIQFVSSASNNNKNAADIATNPNEIDLDI